MGRDEALSWDDLRYVEAVDRLGTAGRAARELGVSASTVYRRIAFLESRVGAPCILRGSGGGSGAGRLTDAGRALAEIARRTESSIGELSRRLVAAREDIAGEVSLTTVEGFIPFIEAPLAALAAQHPRLQIVLHIGDQGPSVRRREVDLAIGVMPKPAESLWGRRLFMIQYAVVGTVEATQRVPLRWISRGAPLHGTLQATWELEHATDVAVRTTSLASTLAFLRRGVGVAILPRKVAALEPTLVEVVALAEVVAALERPAWLLTHPDIQDVPRVRAVMDALIGALAPPDVSQT